jgi:magnesium-dependent phosphatase 1
MHEKSGIAYEDMLFFDNERRNCQDVAPMGVVCVYTPRGMQTVEWYQGLEDFATSKKMAQKFSHH